MSATSTFESSSAPRGRIAAMTSRPLALALIVTAAVTALRVTGTVDSDVAWQLWIAGRLHAGANLYTDIIETNPPLWFWMAVPVERAAAILHLRIESAIVVAIGISVALALTATERLTRYLEPVRRGVFGAPSARFLFGPFAAVGLATLVVVATQWRTLSSGRAPLAVALALSGAAFAAVYFVQFKGWIYHSIPMIGCSSLALAALLAE